MNSSHDAQANSTLVLLLKTKSTPNDGYEEQFSPTNTGGFFDSTFVPVLEHNYLDNGLSVVEELLRRQQIGISEGMKYGGLIFTSQRAVEVFSRLVDEGKGDESWPHLQDVPIYTVGPATSRALRSIPQTPPLNIFGGGAGNGEALAHYILDHYYKWYEEVEIKPPLLFMVGEQRRDIIPNTLMNPELGEDRRIQVDELEVYGTKVMESFEQNFTKILQDTIAVPDRWVVVFSPTGCEAMLRALDMLDPKTGRVKTDKSPQTRGNIYIATIGPTTRDYLKTNFGYEPDVCAEAPSPKGIEDGIKKFMNNRQ